MRRRLALLGTIVLGLLLTAGPALATEGGAGTSDGGDDLWTGLIYAAIAGVILGVIAFVDSTTGPNSLDDPDHEVH